MAPDQPKQHAPKTEAEDETAEAGMSRLLKAKQRAREGMKEEEK